MDDFIFRGRALREFRAHAFFGKTTTRAGAAARSTYDVGGDELLDLDELRGKTFTRTVTIVPADGVRATEGWQRAICRWLRGARAPLMMTGAPDVYRLATFDGDIRFSRAKWPHGALETNMTLSGYVYAARENTAEFDAGTSGRGALYFDTGEARPLRVRIAPGSGAVIASASISVGVHTVALNGLSAASELVIDQSGERASVTADGALCFDRVTAWDELLASSGDAVDVTIGYSAGGAASVRLSARGRWLE